MKCSSCNAEDIKGLYCSNCGAKLTQEQEISSSESINNMAKGKEHNAFEEALNQYSNQSKKEVGITSNKILAFFGVLGLLILFIVSSFNSESKPNNINSQSSVVSTSDSAKNVEIKTGFELIDQKKYDAAVLIFYKMQIDDISKKPLYYYAEGLKKLSEGDYQMAKYYADSIKEYNGYDSERITAFKNKIAIEITPQKLAQQEAQEKAQKKKEGVSIGMTQQEVLDSSWGKPNHINKTTTSYTMHEQWVYGNGNYLYFDDGILKTIQN